MQVSVTSADKGDIVLVIWSDEHSNYQVYHEVLVIVGCLYRDNNTNCLVQGPSLHFLHTESVSSLGLATGTARRRQITAEVVDKEYCQVGVLYCTVLYCTVM